MPVSFATGSFQKTGSQTYPAAQSIPVGFQPKAMIIFGAASGTSTLSGFTDNERPGLGWTTGATANYALSWGYDDQTVVGALTNTFRRARNDYCYTHGSASATAYPLMRCTGFTSTTGEFELDLNDTTAQRMFWVAIGGTDIQNAKAGEFTCNTTTGNQSVTTGIGFQPDIVFFLTGNSPNLTHPTSGSSSTPHLNMAFGVAKSSTARASMCSSSLDGINPSQSSRRQRTDRCLMLFTEGTETIDAEADFVSMNAGGFTINWTVAPSVPQPIYYLAIKGGTWNVGATLSRTSAVGTGTTAITGLGHTPKGLVMFGHQAPDHGNVTTHAEFSFGAAASTSQSVHMNSGNMDNSTVPSSYRSYNVGTAPANVYVYKNHSVGIQNQNNDAAGGTEADFLTSRALLQSFDTNTGFTLNWNQVPTTAEQVIYVTVGDAVGAALSKTINETVGLTEATPNKTFDRIRNIAETVGFTETVVKKTSAALQKVLPTDTVGITEGALIKVLKKQGTLDSTLGIVEEINRALTRRRTINETVGLTDLLSKHIITPTSTLQATFIELRFSGGTTNNITTASRGGAMSNIAVTDGTMNNAWDDITSLQSSSGITEYRCYYLYNTHATLTAYDTVLWIDSTTPAGDTIDIAVGSAAVGGTEQTIAAETGPAPSGGVVFVTAPNIDSALPLGNLPPLTSRSIWLRRTVPAGTASWSDNQYRLRMAFSSDWISIGPPPPPSGGIGFTPTGFTSTGYVTS